MEWKKINFMSLSFNPRKCKKNRTLILGSVSAAFIRHCFVKRNNVNTESHGRERGSFKFKEQYSENPLYLTPCVLESHQFQTRPVVPNPLIPK